MNNSETEYVFIIVSKTSDFRLNRYNCITYYLVNVINNMPIHISN